VSRLHPRRSGRSLGNASPACNWAELHQLTLQMVAASRPSAQQRARRASSSAVKVLGSLAGVLASWDLSVLVRGAG
jgi:hypothetical protein